jgi:hypothetical protein
LIMPIVRMPDGKQVRFPDDMSKDEIKGIISKKYPDAFKAKDSEKPAASAADTATDALIGAGSGITDAAVSLGELPAELASGARWLANKAGVPMDRYNQFTKAAKMNPLVGGVIGGSQALRDEMANPTTSVGKGLKAYREYKPETTVGDYAKTTGEFAAAAIGPKQGLLTRAGKYVLAPALASETAGQVTEGTDLEPYARAAGGLLGLGGGALALNRLGERGARKALKTTEDFQKTGHDAYEEAKNARVIIRRSTIDNLKSGLAQHLDDIGFLPGSEQKANAVLNDIWKNLDSNPSRVFKGRGSQTGFGQKPLNLWELDKVGSKIATKIKDLNPQDKGDRRVLWAAKHYIDDYAQNLGQNDIIAGDLPRGLMALKKAKENWKTKSKLELLDQIEQSAEDTGNAVYTRGGVEHATRREVLKFLRKDPNKRQRLTDAETEAMRKVSHGTVARNALRGVGKLGNSPTSALFSGTAAGLGGSLLGGPVGLALGFGVPAAGVLARVLSKQGTRKAVNDARSIIINDGKKLKRSYKTKFGTAVTLNELLNDQTD